MGPSPTPWLPYLLSPLMASHLPGTLCDSSYDVNDACVTCDLRFFFFPCHEPMPSGKKSSLAGASKSLNQRDLQEKPAARVMAEFMAPE